MQAEQGPGPRRTTDRSVNQPATHGAGNKRNRRFDRGGTVMDHRTTSRFSVLMLGGVAGLMLAIIAGRPEIAIAATAPLLVATVAAFVHRRPQLTVAVHLPSRAVEGDQIDITVSIDSTAWVPWLQVDIQLPPDMDPVDGIRHALVSVPAGGRATVRFPVELTKWGVAVPGRIEAVARGPFGLFVSSTMLRPTTAVRIHPKDGNRPSVVVPAKLRASAGAHNSQRHGDGSDFAEVRPFRTGDSLRSLNWRVSARRNERWVTVRHPDQSGDLVFLLDSFRDLGPESNRLLQRSVRAAMSLAESNLNVHDRVGLLDVGLHIRWYRPRQGRLQRARLLDALLESQAEPGLSVLRISQLPLHELHAGVMVVFITGLTDPGMSLLPIELKLRGLEVSVLECDADDHLPNQNDEPSRLAARLWRVQRAKARQQLIDHGVPVMTWSADQPIELPVAALSRQRSSLRRGSGTRSGTGAGSR